MTLLFCLDNWCQSLDAPYSLYGGSAREDTTVLVSVNDIRIINKKLIERKYYIKISNEQDSIIRLQNEYNKEQSIIINNLQYKIKDITDINDKLQEDYNKQKRKTIIAGSIAGTTSVILAATLIGVLINK